MPHRAFDGGMSIVTAFVVLVLGAIAIQAAVVFGLIFRDQKTKKLKPRRKSAPRIIEAYPVKRRKKRASKEITVWPDLLDGFNTGRFIEAVVEPVPVSRRLPAQVEGPRARKTKEPEVESPHLEDLCSALKNLGYNKGRSLEIARQAVVQSAEDASLDELLARAIHVANGRGERA